MIGSLGLGVEFDRLEWGGYELGGCTGCATSSRPDCQCYGPNEDRELLVPVEEGKKLTVQFEVLDIHSSENCEEDYISLSSEGKMTKLCCDRYSQAGNRACLRQTFTSDVKIHFHSSSTPRQHEGVMFS